MKHIAASWSLVLVSLVLFFGVNSVEAATRLVPTDFATIQGAIDVSQPGDTVLVMPGIYLESIRITSGITVRSTNGREQTTLDASGQGDSAITVEGAGSPSVCIEGFTITGGEGKTVVSCITPAQDVVGGGLYAFGSELAVQDCRFDGNGGAIHGIYAGGGAFLESCIVTITGTEFLRNGVENEGDFVQVGGGLALCGFPAEIDMSDCLFLGNGRTALGGAVFLGGAGGEIARVRDTEFRENSAGFGAAIADTLSSGSLDIESCSFDRNDSSHGGGLYLIATTSQATVSILDSTFAENVPDGVFMDLGAVITARLERCAFTGNMDRGGIFANLTGGSELECIDSTFIENQGAFGAAFNVDVSEMSSVRIANSILTGNVSDHGGAMLGSADDSGSIRIEGCVVSENSATFGGGLNLTTGPLGTIDVTNCTLARNQGSFGPGIFASASQGTIRIANTVIRDGLQASGSVVSVDNHLPSDPGPLFRDESGGDYRLCFGSPAIDGGDNASVPAELVLDADRTPRFHDGNGDGVVRVDLGAYEYGSDPSECATGTVNAGVGSIVDVLLVNGSSGGPSRTVVSPSGGILSISLDDSPAGSGRGRYVLWGWSGTATNAQDLVVRGASVGCVVNPTPVHIGLTPQPILCIPSSGISVRACPGVRPGRPSVPWMLAETVERELTVTLQALIEDQGAIHPVGFSTTNAVTVVVE